MGLDPGCPAAPAAGAGVVSPYCGGRTIAWLKVKQPRYREDERGWEPKNKS